MPSIDTTIDFLKQLYGDARDKSGKPMWQHPVAVMHRLPRDVDDEVRLAALLHDVVEDISSYDCNRLTAMGYSNRTLDIVALLTKSTQEPQPYVEYIRSVITSGNRDAMEVKLADMLENSDRTRLCDLDELTQQRLLQKYARPIRMMREALNRSNPLPTL